VIKAVVFDFGGVLMRTGDPIGRREWETRLGLPQGELERIVHGSETWITTQHGQMTVDDYWRWVANTTGISESEVLRLQYDYFRDDVLDKSLMMLIASLRKSGYKLGLLSNDSAALEQKLRQELSIYDEFDAVVISAHIGVMKPDAKTYEAIAHALGVTLTECVFIDDNEANIDGARRVGMTAIHYRANMDLTAALNEVLK
jgi:epoxide hydrolase-like predicted phosphatase